MILSKSHQRMQLMRLHDVINELLTSNRSR